MKKICIGIAIGLALGIILILIGQDYLATKIRVSNIENFLNQSIKQLQQAQRQPQPAIQPEEK